MSRPGFGCPSTRAGGALAALLLLAAAPAAAEVGVGARVGTLGVGPELSWTLGGSVEARVAGGFLDIDTSYGDTGIEYDAEAELRTALLLFDWHPGGGGFRLTAGGGWNGTGLDVSAPVEDLLRREVPDLPPLPFDLGKVSGRAEGRSFVPYAGIGWGRPLGVARARGRWSVSLDLGAAYHGEPEVELGTDLPVALPTNLQQLLDQLAAEEEAELEEELREYTWLPVISLGLSLRL
jgi:hypothetical protein